MKKFCNDLKEHATKIIHCEKIPLIPLTYEENKSYKNQKVCYMCKRRFITDEDNKVRDHCHFTGKYRGAAHNNCNMNYEILIKVPLVFHNGSTHDNDFIIKELEKEFEGQFDCLGKNTEKYITFSVPIDKKLHKLIKIIMKKLKTYLTN